MTQHPVMHDIKGSEFLEAREAAGLTQTRLGELFEVHRTTVVRWEKSAVLPRGRAVAVLQALRDLAARTAA